MSRYWMLLETLGLEPTVVAIGSQARNMVPLISVLRRNRHRPLIEAAIAECRATGELVVAHTPAQDRAVRVCPVAMDRTQIHGVHVWFGPADEEPSPRPIAGAYLANLDTSVSTVTKEFLDVVGTDPNDRAEKHTIAEDLAPLLPSLHDVEMFANVVNPTLGRPFGGTCPAADYQGNLIQIHYAGRADAEPSAAGGLERVARILCTRVERAIAEPQVGLAQHILEAVSTPGEHRLLVNVDNFSILKWIDDPYPQMAWRYDPDNLMSVHPDDHDVAFTMREELRAGSTTGVLRVRSTSGGWLPVHVKATKFMLRDNAFAALVTLSAARGIPSDPPT